MHKQNKQIFLLIFLFFCTTVLANTDNFKNYLSYADSQKSEVTEAASKFDPQTTFKDYTSNPPEQKYYGGVVQSGDKGLDSDAASNVSKDNAGSTVDNAFKTRPVFKINPNSQDMQRSALIKNDSYDISRGISDKYVNCQKAHSCTTRYVTETCDEQTRFLERRCVKTPNVTVSTTKTISTGNLTPDGKYSGFLIVPTDGVVTAFKITAHVDGYAYNPSAALQGVVLAYKKNQGGGNTPTFASDKLYIQIKKGSKLEFTLIGYSNWWFIWSRKVELKSASYSITIQTKVSHVDWQEVCNDTFSNFVNCSATKTECTQPGGTRYFDGVSITLPCWQYTETQKCSAPSDNNCVALRDKNCTQIGAKCRTMLRDICAVQDETYNCAVKNCSASDGIECGGQFFCMKGDCSDHTPEQNQNFDKAASEMAAIGSGAEDIKKTNGASAFTGQSMSCRKIGFGSFNNCCKNSGWGHNIGLAHCNDEERRLGHDKEKGLVVDVGFKCDKHYPWPIHGCMKGREVYCVFPSKIAYIIQTQGREQQLHIGYGSAGNPNCDGLTPDELSVIDFSKIDFSAIYKQIEGNTSFPNDNEAAQKIANRVKDFYDHNQNH